MKISEQALRHTAETALQISSGGVTENVCDVVANEFAFTLETEFNCEGIIGATRTSVNGSKHFVALVPAKETTIDTDSEHIIVDATLTQFSDIFSTEVPKIVILPCDEYQRWYDTSPCEKI